MQPMEAEVQLQGLDHVTLTGLARQILENQAVDVEDWQVQANKLGRGSATAGVYQITGTARDQDKTLPWALILKVLSPLAHGLAPAALDIAHPLYWKREALVYQSGLLDSLPEGLILPRCLGCVEQVDGSIWLWLEERKDAGGPHWPLEQFGRAANAIGRFNGLYLTQKPIPAYPWLTRDGSPRGVTDYFGWIQEKIQDPLLWEHPVIHAAFPVPVKERLAQLWIDRCALLDVLERLPYTLCHMDFWRKNLFAPCGLDGPIVVIDWAYSGRGVIGTDAGDLMAPSYFVFGAEPCSPAALDNVIFENYVEGLHEAGWPGKREPVRFAYATFAAIKYGCLLFDLLDVLREDHYEPWEQLSGHPMAETINMKAELIYFLLDLADEARRLSDKVT